MNKNVYQLSVRYQKRILKYAHLTLFVPGGGGGGGGGEGSGGGGGGGGGCRV